MPRGGARNHSGPPKDPNSGRSERRGYVLTALPAEGYDGPIPVFPLPKRVITDEYVDEGQRVRETDEGATAAAAEREAELWAWVWRTPQACAWSMLSESWRLHAIAMWVRTAVLCESNEATAADKNSLHRFADQIGMSPAGLAMMGWKVAEDELAKQAAARPAASAPVKRERRLRAAK